MVSGRMADLDSEEKGVKSGRTSGVCVCRYAKSKRRLCKSEPVSIFTLNVVFIAFTRSQESGVFDIALYDLRSAPAGQTYQ
jgi:hypothetical protein